MRRIIVIFLVGCGVYACVKPKTKDPIPVIDFISVDNLSKIGSVALRTLRDTADLVIGYQDGDGDIFRNTSADGPNFFYTVYRFDADSQKMVKDGALNPLVIRQPNDGYYKGKSIQGQITVPINGYRSDTTFKKIRFDIFMVDMKDHKSNMVSSPVYTLNF